MATDMEPQVRFKAKAKMNQDIVTLGNAFIDQKLENSLPELNSQCWIKLFKFLHRLDVRIKWHRNKNKLCKPMGNAGRKCV